MIERERERENLKGGQQKGNEKERKRDMMLPREKERGRVDGVSDWYK